MKNIAVGCWPALLAATLHLALLQLGGTVSVRRQPQPHQKNIVGALRAALTSRTEELHNQKNIAHGLELEVRELQSELQSEKKALAKESAKEQVLQLRLNRVRSVLEDGSSGTAAPQAPLVVAAASQRAGTNVPPQDHTAAGSVEADAPVNASSQLSAPVPVQNLEESAREVQTQNETLDVADSELEAAEESAQQEQQPPLAPKNSPTQSLAPNQQLPQEQAPPAPRVAPTKPPTPDRQLAQEQPPAPGAAPPQGGQPVVATKPMHPVKLNVAKLPPTAKTPTPQLKVAPQQYRDLVSKTKQLREARSDQASTAPPPSPVAGDAGGQKGAEAGADFDALEAQLHEEDRRIQDLDRENALDAMTDSGGAAPATMIAPARSNRSSFMKTVPAPKLELDSEAPMEDFLSVEAPGPEPTSEAAIGTPAVAASETPQESTGLALPQVAESVGAGLDGAFSDEKFLSQMATTARH